MIQNITERHGLETQLRRLARTDDLTQLANRAEFNRVLDARLHEARTANSDVGLLLIDLDGFKGVNDALGNAAGDVVLRHVADWLRSFTYERWLPPRLEAISLRSSYLPASIAQDWTEWCGASCPTLRSS
ncbi:hypothetical protein ASF18_01910 [Methylobacterium sp. Leaf89]|nr:hypothetical protein ASF18_01910 [Methylobacterium sp. Leaf89]